MKDRSVFPILLTYFIDNFGLAIVYSVFTRLFLRTGDSPLLPHLSLLDRSIGLGIVIAVFPLAQIFGAPLIGKFSDLYGRKISFFITLLGGAIGYFATAISLVTYSIWLLLLSRIWTGFFSGNLTLCLAAVADMSPDAKTRTKNFGLITTVSGLSFTLAILTEWLLSHAASPGHRHPSILFWFLGCLTFFNLFLVQKLFQESFFPSERQSAHLIKNMRHIFSSLSNYPLRMLYLVYFFFMISWRGATDLLPSTFLDVFTFTTWQISSAFALIGIVWALTSFLLHRYLARYISAENLFRASLLFLGCLLIAGTFPSKGHTFLLLFLFSTCFASLSWTNGLAAVSLHASASTQGSVLGFNQAMSGIATILGLLIGTFLALINLHLIYLFTGLAALVSFAIIFLYRRKIDPSKY